MREAKVDEVYHAKVVRIEKFGAFVNLFDKTDALVHISEMAWTRTNRVEDLVAIGDEVDVKIIKIDEKWSCRCFYEGTIATSAKNPEHSEEKMVKNGPRHGDRPRHHNKDHKPKKRLYYYTKRIQNNH